MVVEHPIHACHINTDVYTEELRSGVTGIGATCQPSHWGQVPDVANERPRRQDVEQVAHHAVLAAIPEGVAEPGIVLATERTTVAGNDRDTASHR